MEGVLYDWFMIGFIKIVQRTKPFENQTATGQTVHLTNLEPRIPFLPPLLSDTIWRIN